MGNAASEVQHFVNQVQGVGPQEKAFLQAVYEGNAKEAAALLGEFPNLIYARTRDWHNAWHIAAEMGSLEMCGVLAAAPKVSRKAIPGEPLPINAKTLKGTTPLHIAYDHTHAEVMEFLLQHEAKVLIGDRYGNTVVHYTAFSNHTRMLEMLLARKEAAGGGDNTRRFTDLRNEHGLMPLHFAVYAGHQDAAKMLICARARLNAVCTSDAMGHVNATSGSAPLHVAAIKGDVEMARLLLDAWAVMNAQPGRKRPVKDPRLLQDHIGMTPLQVGQGAHRTNTTLLKLLDPKYRISPPASHEFTAISTRGRLSGPGSETMSHSPPVPQTVSRCETRLATDESDGHAPGAHVHAYSPLTHEEEEGEGQRREGADDAAAAAPRPSANHPLASRPSGYDLHTPTSPSRQSSAALDPPSASETTPPRSSSPAPHARIVLTPVHGPPGSPWTPPGRGVRSRLGSLHSLGGGDPEESDAERAARQAREAEEAARKAEEDQAAAARALDERKDAAEAAGLPPPRYVCPLSLSVMDDPVTAADGYNYERSAIQDWFDMGADEFPGNGVPITSTHLTPNNTLAAEIAAWRQNAIQLQQPGQPA